MKTFLTTIFFLVMLSSEFQVYSQNLKEPNPAAAYIKFLGYKYETRKDPAGAEYGVCILPDGSECMDFDFYKGLCGKKYSYCTLKGCETKTRTENIGSGTIQYAVCSCTDSHGVVTDIPLSEFMEIHGDTLFKFNPKVRGNYKK